MLLKKNILVVLLLIQPLFFTGCSPAQEPAEERPIEETPAVDEETNEEAAPEQEQAEEEETEAEEEVAGNETPVAIHGQLRIQGKNLVDQNGENIQLRGMSLFWSQWEPEFYNFETVKNLKEGWNVNVIRAAMAIEHDGYLQNPEREKEKVYRVIDAAIELGIYVIVDWHDHHAEDHIEASKEFFGELAQKYGDKPNLLYETYNEPLDVSWSNVLKPYHKTIISEIRSHDPDNIIICGTPRWSQRVDLAAEDPIEGDNIAYTLHYYAATHKQELRNIAQTALNKNLPLFITEFGTTLASGDDEINVEESHRWWNFAEENNISWCNWSIADKDEKSAAIIPGTTPEQLKDDEVLTESGRLVKAELTKE
ncbi:glycoside hydrolase family 5 protein [Salegentibacter sp. F188]|uniref:Glycoside hydrolase family 5 protein n=1 Tax=Autumnicola patrickiae TaxID=3075591 RepID=A0ABU3DZ22_9FLAO|nr:glycoside hydrolase family 5 protein [Salegentibacter sp. F188]MDT0688984.1 glycoside hydrolase family 5 protein [Salegentibacter sp. F188]